MAESAGMMKTREAELKRAPINSPEGTQAQHGVTIQYSEGSLWGVNTGRESLNQRLHKGHSVSAEI